MITNRLRSLTNVRRIELSDDTSFPRLYRSPGATVRLDRWLEERREVLVNDLREHGALVFRGFQVDGDQAFLAAVRVVCPRLHDGYGDLPREGGALPIYGVTPYPPSEEILFHCEASHTPSWPRQLWFYCKRPAEIGGETPVVRTDVVFEGLDRDIGHRFERLGLRYIRRFLPNIDVPWEEFFHTSRREVVEARCESEKVSCRWLDRGGLELVTPRSAVADRFPRGRRCFFNQILLHHPACLEPEVREGLNVMLGEGQYPRDVKFGDFSSIPDDTVLDVLDAMINESVCFSWAAGDVMVIDNIAVAHARRRFSGARDHKVALSEFVSR